MTRDQIYRDLADNGRLDGHYTRAEVEGAFNMPPAIRSEVPPMRMGIKAPRAVGAQPEASTPATSTPEFWIALFLVAVLVWWCVDRIVIKARRKR
jgi:hypothetical protein